MGTEPEGEVLTCFYEHEVHGVTKVKKRYPYYVEELDDNRKPFRCNLDVGIQTVTTGNRVLGAMKGASDGGLDIPHSEKRFPGYDREDKKYDAEVHKDKLWESTFLVIWNIYKKKMKKSSKNNLLPILTKV